MTEAKREVWIIEDKDGHCFGEFYDDQGPAEQDAKALVDARAIRYVPEGWIDFIPRQPGHYPVSGEPVQFVTYNGATVGYRNDDGSWYDALDIGQDGTPNHDYSDDQVTHWAPLLAAPPKAEAAK